MNKKESKKLLSLYHIPSDVQTILDVGCGNGWFLNSLNTNFQRVVGIDSSQKALEYVQTEKIHGDIVALPFQAGSFDLVACLEVIEHLPYATLIEGLKELERVSRKYIIVSVPNNEDLELSLVVCPHCHCRYNPYFHLRNFNHSVMKDLFKQFRLIECKEIGELVSKPTYNHALFSAYLTWIKPFPPKTAICPQCGYQTKNAQSSNEVLHREREGGFVKKILHLPKIVAKNTFWKPQKTRRWLLALYSKEA